MQYLVRLTDRALWDLEAIYEFIEVDSSKAALEWFNGLAEAIYSLEQFPERGATVPENKKLRHLLFGQKPNTYRIIYALDKRKNAVNILHIRHGARTALPIGPEEDT
ncbi:MAG TPA: type II toxin-antitoxin system RelE/ParE family toxin [Candidatus Acidoferrum sp.]|nr:type II toxin-antitoxin system RelE/ParE family toxin [Candidatus Acidoferrum sp.]